MLPTSKPLIAVKFSFRNARATMPTIRWNHRDPANPPPSQTKPSCVNTFSKNARPLTPTQAPEQHDAQFAKREIRVPRHIHQWSDAIIATENDRHHQRPACDAEFTGTGMPEKWNGNMPNKTPSAMPRKIGMKLVSFKA